MTTDNETYSRTVGFTYFSTVPEISVPILLQKQTISYLFFETFAALVYQSMLPHVDQVVLVMRPTILAYELTIL